MNPVFQNAVGNMCGFMDALKLAEEHTWNDRRKAPKAGVYVFYENGKPIYVGRSNNIPQRISSHGSASRHSATFALKLLRERLKGLKGTAKDIEENHGEEYRREKDRVRSMTFRAVAISNQLEQTLFEVYAILELDTLDKFNDFDTH